MHKTELCFRELHQRIMHLEERQAAQGPTDEQVERVLRKILAEKFSNSDKHLAQHSHDTWDRKYFVENPDGVAHFSSIPFDPASLVVDPDSVPSKAYAETFRMLESRIANFPRLGREEDVHPCANGIKENVDIKQPRGSDTD